MQTRKNNQRTIGPKKLAIKSILLIILIVVATTLPLTLGAIFLMQTLSPLYQQPLSKILTATFGTVSKSWQDNNLVQSLTYLCSLEQTDGDKVRCIQEYVCNHYDYAEHPIFNQIRINPEQIIQKGGVCRDYAVLYKSILDNLKLPNKFILTKDHIYNEITLDNETYSLDQCSLYTQEPMKDQIREGL